MAKIFGQLRVNDIINITNGGYPFGAGINFDNCIATVTNIDIHGDFIIISYKTPYFNHTVSVSKRLNEYWVVVRNHRYHKYKREFKFVYKISI